MYYLYATCKTRYHATRHFGDIFQPHSLSFTPCAVSDCAIEMAVANHYSYPLLVLVACKFTCDWELLVNRDEEITIHLKVLCGVAIYVMCQGVTL